MSELPARLKERVLADAAEATPSVFARRAGTLRTGVALVGLVGFAQWFLRGASDMPAVVHRDPWTAFLVPAGLALMMTVGALRHGKRSFGPPVGQLVGACLLGPVALALVAIAPRSVAAMADAMSATNEPHATIVAAVGLVMVLLALAPPVDPSRAQWRGAALGAAAGAWVSVSCSFTCPIVRGFHVIVTHVAYVPILGILGAVLAHTYDRLSYRNG